MPKHLVRRCLAIVTVTALSLGLASPVHASIVAEVWDTDGDNLIVRQAPTSTATALASLAEGTQVTIQCQTFGQQIDGTTIWDYLPQYGGYVTDRYVYTGYDGRHPELPECGSGQLVEGFDNSNNNEGTIDWDTTAERFGFAIMKASESTDFVDAYFAQRFQAAHGRLILGAYHFFDPRADGTAQADHNLDVLADAGYRVSDADTLPIMVDVEPNYVEPGVGFCFGVDASTMNSRLNAYIARITAATGEAPMVYTNGEMINDCGLDTEPLTDLPLVVPAWEQWNADPQATAQSLGWSTWTFWQYKSWITLPGGVGALADRFHGDQSALAALAAG